MAKVTTSLYGAIALLPYQPQVPVRESLEYLTEVLISQNGTEERQQLRAYPRQGFTFSYPEQAASAAAAFNAQYGGLRQLHGVPVWTEAQYIGAVSSGASTLSCVTTGYDFRAASLALLFQAPDTYKVLEISTVGSGVLNLSNTTTAFTRAYLMPLRVGYRSGAVQRSSSGHGALSSVTYEVEDNGALSASAPTQFLGSDIYFDAPLEQADDNLDARTEVVDGQLGKIARRTLWTYNRIGRTHRGIASGVTEVRSLKTWLARRAGRYRQYWEPTFLNDLRRQSSGTVTSSYLVASDGLLDWDLRTHVAFELDDGTWLARTITSSSQISPTQVQLNLDTSLGGIAPTRIARVCWLGLKRLNTDRLEIEWIGNSVVRYALNILELQP